jgi:Fic family protein
MNALEKAEQLKQELDSLRPLDAEAEARIMQKFRLDWNYHSNNLEGNSLTYGETKALILFGITAQGKPLKDHFEITGHNEAINWILEIIKDETPLNEKFIRELHTLLLKESSYKEAQTAEGNRTRRKIEVGKYKTQPNHVVTVTGETFYFATPEETPAKMHELIEWFRNEKEKQGVNPIILAALFHYRFIRIHPFDDGNGRTARILMNFILMQFGYPPAIIKTEDKENYFAVLRLADADQLEPFIEYIAQNLVRSLEIMIRGAKGDSIEEAEDLDKELALLERKFDVLGKKVEKIKTIETVSLVIESSMIPLLKEFFRVCQKFEKFYIQSEAYIYVVWEGDSYSTMSADYSHERLIVFESNGRDIPNDLDVLLETILANIVKGIKFNQINKLICLEIGFSYETLNRVNVDTSFLSLIWMEFNEKSYVLCDESCNERVEKLYSEQISLEEIVQVVSNESKKHKVFLEELLKQS